MRTFKAKTNIAASTFVVLEEEQLKQASGSTDNIIGIADSVNAEAGDVCDILENGTKGEIITGGTFLAGDALTSDTKGRAVKATAGDNIGAIAYESSSGENQIVAVMVTLCRTIAQETQNNDTIGG